MTPTAKWLGVGLVASLALNLFVIGAWVGKIARHEKPETERVTLGSMTESLSPEGRNLLRSAMHMNRKEAIPIFKELNAARARANAALDATPYDPEAYAQALRDLRTYSEAGQTLLHATLVDVVGKLSPEDRHRLAQESKKMLEAARKRDRERRNGRAGDALPPPPMTERPRG